MQLRFTSLVLTYLRRDLHPQEYAQAGRTMNSCLRNPHAGFWPFYHADSSTKNSGQAIGHPVTDCLIAVGRSYLDRSDPVACSRMKAAGHARPSLERIA